MSRSHLRGRAALFSLVSLGALLGSTTADAITREEVLVRAKAYAFHPWTAAPANMTASCNGSYASVYGPGDYMGLPYDWGGYMTLFQFDQQIASGYGAGSYPADGVLACTSGVDCSGYVSKTWDTGHYATATVHNTSDAIDLSAMLPGDIFNEAGYHMALFNQVLGNGEPEMYESVGYNVHYSLPGWSWVQGYVPRRFDGITGTTVGNPIGTSTNPIGVSSFPYSDSRNTTQSPSDVLDGCGAAPNTKETGPEYIYEVTITQPGTLTVLVQDDAGVDIDVHLYTSMNTNDCVARNDTTLTEAVDCGTYYVVADTFKGASEYPGAYSLTMDFAPSGNSCGSGPPGYAFEGEVGDDCAYPGDESLPFCNPNLGATTCLYSSSDSFCSKPCTVDADCAALTGGCCGDLGGGETYCFTADLCGGGGGTGGGVQGGEDPPPPEGDPGVGGSTGEPSTGAGGSDPGMPDPSTGSGTPPPMGTPAAAETSSGCAAAPGRTSPSGWWLALAGLALTRRRRR